MTIGAHGPPRDPGRDDHRVPRRPPGTPQVPPQAQGGPYAFLQILIDILKEMVPDATPLHTLHHWALSVIGQCFYYRANEKILTMLIDGEELREEFTVEKLSEHITDVILRGLGRRPPLGRSPTVSSLRSSDERI